MKHEPHILIDARVADLLGTARTGVGRYATEITRALAAARPSWRFTVFSNRTELEDLGSGTNVVSTRWPTDRVAGRIAWLHLKAATEGRSQGADLWYAPVPLIPARWRGPAVATVHDLVFVQRPDLYRGRLNSLHARWALRRVARRCNALVCVSETTRRVLEDFVPDIGSRVDVIRDGVSTAFLERGHASARIEAPYLLFVGTFEARKGLDTLVAALDRFEGKTRVVLAGRPGWRADEALSRLCHREGVEIVLEPSDERLAELYRGAAALLYPSRLEGFGLPVAEAIASACPVISSDLPAIREWAGEVPRYVPVGDAEGLAGAIRSLLADPRAAALRAERLAVEHPALTWATVGDRVAAVMERALDAQRDAAGAS
jgi:glycosyltransferase involved in cell wall biosynthesis